MTVTRDGTDVHLLTGGGHDLVRRAETRKVTLHADLLHVNTVHRFSKNGMIYITNAVLTKIFLSFGSFEFSLLQWV